jgi:hypothetical protein
MANTAKSITGDSAGGLPKACRRAVPISGNSVATHYNVILNWLEELKHRVPLK